MAAPFLQRRIIGATHEDQEETQKPMTAKQVGHALINGGISTLPTNADGSKRPIGKWNHLKGPSGRLLKHEEIDKWSNDCGVGIVCGVVSGNLEIIDIEGHAEVVAILKAIPDELLSRLPMIRTPSGGCHLLYRCEEIEGNQKLAMKQAGDGTWQTHIETRGEGGYVQTVGSPRHCHAAGELYELNPDQPPISKTPTFTVDERAQLLDSLREWNDYHPEDTRKAVSESPPTAQRGASSPDSPGSDYLARGNVIEVLERHGWRVDHTHGDEIHLTRPGKKTGTSAIWHSAERWLYIFSTAIQPPLEPLRSYNPFGVYCLLEHDGDFSRGAGALRVQGFGSDKRAAPLAFPTPGDSDAPPDNIDTPTGDEIKSPTPYEAHCIQVTGGSLYANVLDADDAIANYTEHFPTRGIYQRFGQLVRLSNLTEEQRRKFVHVEKGTIEINPLTVGALRANLTGVAVWSEFDKRINEWKVSNCPDEVARGLIGSSTDWLKTPVLRAVAEAPVLLPDGTVFQHEGYDESTQLYSDYGGTKFPPIPAKPTRDDALAALTDLDELISGFPFQAPIHRSVALAMILTGVIRTELRTAPMFAISAPKPGTGKTLLGSIPAYIATGRGPAMFTQSVNDPEEEKKQFLGLLTSGSTFNCMDNVDRQLKSDALCTIITEPVWVQRILGTNRSATVGTRALWVATGNNISISGDLNRRTLHCYLEYEGEHPSDRTFPIDIHKFIPKNRGRLAAAAITILSAYHHYRADGGDSPETKKWRFDEWEQRIQEPLVWLGLPDPVEVIEELEDTDERTLTHRELMESWFAAHQDEPITPGNLIRLAKESGSLSDDHKLQSAILEALEGVAMVGNRVDGRKLRQYLTRHRGTISDGLKLSVVPKRTPPHWRVEVVSLTPERAEQILEKSGATVYRNPDRIEVSEYRDSPLFRRVTKFLHYPEPTVIVDDDSPV